MPGLLGHAMLKPIEAMILGLEDLVTFCDFTVESLDTDDEKKIARVLRRRHENLGHPSNPWFVAMLKVWQTCQRFDTQRMS